MRGQQRKRLAAFRLQVNRERSLSRLSLSLSAAAHPARKLIWGIFSSVFPGQPAGRESRLPALRGSLGAAGGLPLAARLGAAVSGALLPGALGGEGVFWGRGPHDCGLSSQPGLFLGSGRSWPRNVFPRLPPPPVPRLMTPEAAARPFSGTPVAQPSSSWVAHVPNAPELSMFHGELSPAIRDLPLLQPPSAFPRGHKGFPISHSLPAHPQSPAVPSSCLG